MECPKATVLTVCAIQDMEKMGMWRPLQDLLTSSETNEDIKVAVLWIIGTAVQNNPAGQRAVSIQFIKSSLEAIGINRVCFFI